MSSLNKVARIFTSADYEGMFTALIKDAEESGKDQGTVTRLQNNIKQEIQWAKKTFKGNNAWIVWWLRWYRLSIAEYHSLPIYATYMREMHAKNHSVTRSTVAYSNSNKSHTDLEHLLSLPVDEINKFRPNYETVQEVISKLKDFEEEWKVDREYDKNTLKPKEDEGDYILVNLGGGWAWWFLNRYSCDEEAKAMGHCGNSGAGEEGEHILSLRKKAEDGKWTPHLTFILDANGYLGEMKGRGNDKPAPKYYPYIVKLLENPIVKGIKGGGYSPEHNFDIKDLSEEEQERLYKLKPGLMSIDLYIKKFGMDESAKEKLKSILSMPNYSNDVTVGDTDVMWSGCNVNDIVRDFFHQQFSELFSRVSDSGLSAIDYLIDNVDIYSETLSGNQNENALKFLNVIGYPYVGDLGETLVNVHESQYEEWLEDKGYSQHYTLNDPQEIVDFAEYVKDEKFIEFCSIALENGLIYHILNLIEDMFRNEFKEIGIHVSGSFQDLMANIIMDIDFILGELEDGLDTTGIWESKFSEAETPDVRNIPFGLDKDAAMRVFDDY